MNLPTEQEFIATCQSHMFSFMLEPDLNKAMEGLQTYHYMQAVIKQGGSKYKKIHRKAFEDYIDKTKQEVRDAQDF
jgi:hypothetical protein